MNQIQKYLSRLGKLGGSSRSKEKVDAARENIGRARKVRMKKIKERRELEEDSYLQ